MRAQGRNSIHHGRLNGHHQEVDHFEHYQEDRRHDQQQLQFVYEEESFELRSVSFTFEEEQGRESVAFSIRELVVRIAFAIGDALRLRPISFLLV